jgi:hypothetical protein
VTDQVTGGFVTPGVSPTGTNPGGSVGALPDAGQQGEGSSENGAPPAGTAPGASGNAGTDGSDDTDDADTTDTADDTTTTDDTDDTDTADDTTTTDDTDTTDDTGGEETQSPDMGDAAMPTAAGSQFEVSPGRLAPTLDSLHRGGDPAEETATTPPPVVSGPIATSGSKGGDAMTPATDATAVSPQFDIGGQFVAVGPSAVDPLDSLGAGFDGVGQTGVDDALKPDGGDGLADDDGDPDGDGVPG